MQDSTLPHNPLVFVAGCPRSGTSPFARWLHACGLNTVDDARRDTRYPSGYFEHLPLLMFHKALEKLPRGADHRITLEPFLQTPVLDDPFIKALYQQAFQPALAGKVDFLKFPQLALSVDFLFEQFPGSHLIGLWRSPAAAFRSLVVNEFPNEMLPSSGIKAVLLWNLYAYHLVAARRDYPDQVSVIDIDAFIATPGLGPKLLERIGRRADQARPVREAIDPDFWKPRVNAAWRAYHAAMAWTCRLLGPRLGAERAPLADQRRWLRELRAISETAQAPTPMETEPRT